MNETLDDAIDRIIVNLKTLGKINIGDKIFLRDGYIVIQKYTLLRSVTRTLYGHGREQSATLVEDILRRAVAATNALLRIDAPRSSEHVSLMQYLKLLTQLRESLSHAKKGLANFMRTYADDHTICSRVDGVLADINNVLSVLDARLDTAELRTHVQRHFPQNLEQYITSAAPAPYHGFATAAHSDTGLVPPNIFDTTH